MAFKHGKDTKIFFNNNDFSQYFNQADTTLSSDVAESTTFGKASKTYIAGNLDGTVSLGGFFDATADASTNTLLGGSDFVFCMGIDGIDATDGVVFGNSNITSYGKSSPVGDIVASSIDVQADGGLFAGNVLENATYTVTASGTARDYGASTGDGGGAFLIVTSASGSTPTLDVKITHSADNTTYADLVSFTQVTTSAGAEFKSVAKGTTVNRYLKVVATLSGTSPNYNAIIGFGRNN